MNRRSFFKTICGAVAGVYAAFVPKAKGLMVADLIKCRDELKANEQTGNILLPVNPEYTKSLGRGDCRYYEKRSCHWKFYINGEEVDSSRAVNENGGIRWPFQGANKGDLCTVKSPPIELSKKRSGPTPFTKEEIMYYCSKHYCWDGCIFWKKSRCTIYS